MKKLFAIVLLVALLVPMVPTAKAAEATAQPFYALGWSDFDQEKYPYMDGLLTTTIKNIGDTVVFHYGGKQVMYGSYTDDDITAMAQVMKTEMDSRPEGMRYWTIFGIARFMRLTAENALFMDKSIVQLKDVYTAILKKYKELGGKLDGVVLDVEYEGLACWYLTTGSGDKQDNNAVKNPMIYKQIVSDPRYATQIRPLLVERGFKFFHNITDYTPEIYCITRDSGKEYDISRSVWDTVMRIHLNRYANEWCYEPLKELYPNASLSDYQSADTNAWAKGATITDDGQSISGGGNTMKVGTASSYSYYYAQPNDDFYKNYNKYASYNQAIYEAVPFNTLLYYVNYTRRMYHATDTKQIAPWMVDYGYNSKKTATLANTAYYSELMYHLGMMDPEPFLVWMYRPNYTEEEWVTYCQTLNELMAELTRVAGYSDRKPISAPEYWNSDFILSGMYANGRNIWRISPNTAEVSVADFKVEGADPTFYVSGQTITFPGGKIVESGVISDVGACGYWVETAKDVTPIVTNDADRLIKIPAFSEDFESYTAGSKLTAMLVRDSGTWSISSKGSDLLVEADGNNKVLAITGNSVMKNIVVPGNVTAADSYAKEQAWELTVTVPAGMTADEALTLLNYEADITQSGKDGGFKISGGKVSYAENGEYKEMTLDISAGGKYTFRRVLNFNNFTSDYIVMDATGKEVASVKGVAILAFKGKVTGIGIACKQVAGKVLLDNYAIRANGAAADFEIYDAPSGILLQEGAVHSVSTAYRLSWINVTEGEKTAAVMADIYEGDVLKETKTIKEVKLTAGCDGVETGIVEVAAGQRVKVYMKTDITTGTTTPGGNGGGATNDPITSETQPAGQTEKKSEGGLSTVVIALIAVVVLGGGGVAAALILTKKKPAKTEE